MDVKYSATSDLKWHLTQSGSLPLPPYLHFALLLQKYDCVIYMTHLKRSLNSHLYAISRLSSVTHNTSFKTQHAMI